MLRVPPTHGSSLPSPRPSPTPSCPPQPLSDPLPDGGEGGSPPLCSSLALQISIAAVGGSGWMLAGFQRSQGDDFLRPALLAASRCWKWCLLLFLHHTVLQSVPLQSQIPTDEALSGIPMNEGQRFPPLEQTLNPHRSPPRAQRGAVTASRGALFAANVNVCFWSW